MRLVTSIFERGIVEGSFRPHNSAHAARMFLGCLAELCEMQVEGASSEERSDYVRTLISTLLKGVSVGCEKRNGHD